MSINKFNTNLDLARQAEIYSGETACFQGGMEMGIPFSGFPAGVDTNTIVSLGSAIAERATFSGSSATTIFDVTNLTSPSFNPTHPTLRTFPYSEIDLGTAVETVSATTYTPLLLSYTANTGISNDPTALSWGNPLLEKLYNTNDSGTTYPNNYFTELFNNIGAAITANTIELDETEYYQLETNNSIYSGAQFNMVVYEQGAHGTLPALVTGTTSGTVTEYSATTFFWSNAEIINTATGLTLPITPLSADTQSTDYVWTLTQSTIIDGNLIGLQYTGYNYTYTFEDVADVSTGTTPEYHGIVLGSKNTFSAGTLDYKGDLTWLNVKGNANVVDRTTTNYMTIKSLGTGSPVTMLAVDVNGNVVGGSGGTTDDAGAFTSTTSNNTIVPTVQTGNTNTSTFTSILGGRDNTSTGSTNSTIGGGQSNILNTSNNSTIGGGYQNLLSGSDNTFIGAGYQNSADTTSINAVVVGGYSNRVAFFESSASQGFIGAGSQNRVGGGWSAIVGGYNNQILHRYSFIGAGYQNYIRNTDRAAIVGGTSNNINSSGGAQNNFIGAGNTNTMTGSSISNSSIVGGQNNDIGGSSDYVFIGGGQDNIVNSDFGFIGGGQANEISTSLSTHNAIVGGYDNIISTSGEFNVIGGGEDNTIQGTGSWNIIGGGNTNRIGSAAHSLNFIGSGDFNSIYGSRCVIGGGRGNDITAVSSTPAAATIGGGWENRIDGASGSVIAGGVDNYMNEGSGGAWGNTIGGGDFNYMLGSGYATIAGGGFFYEQGTGPNPPYGNLAGNKISNSYWSFIGGGSNNLISGGTYVSWPGNFTVDANFSSIIAGSGNTAYHRNVHLIGMNLTSISADTTYVEKLNIGTLNGTAINVGLGLDINGMVVSGSTGSGGNFADTNLTFDDDRTHTLSGNSLTLSTTGDSNTFVVSPNGNVGVRTSATTSFNFEVNGSFGATSKSFIIPHPTKDGKKLVYGAIEGPEFGVYYRGEVNGKVIELPEYWSELVDETSITVQLTAIGGAQNLYVEKIENNKVFINSSGWFSTPHCYYTVYGERKDIDKINLEIDA